MVINAYQKIQRVPNMEEVKSSSRFSKCCGSLKDFNSSIIALLGAIIVGAVINYNCIIALVFVFFTPCIVKKMSKIGCLNFLQVFVTVKPTEKELLVAIKGLEEWEKENYYFD